MQPKHLLSIQDLTPKDLDDLLYLTSRLKSLPHKYYDKLHRKTLGLLFNKPSTRTRVSFESGTYQLGGNVVFLTEKEIQIGRGESIHDTAKVLSRYMDAIVIRTYNHNILLDYAKNSSIPVINGLTDLLHPCQILADIFTIKEKKGGINGINLAYIGDGANNIAHSWLLAASKTGINLRIATPAEHQPNPKILAMAEQGTKTENKGSIEITSNPQTAANNADIIYTDVWISMGQEKEKADRLDQFKPYQINKELLTHANPQALIMHCLPAHPGEEITEDVLYSPHSIVFDQAENRLHLQKSLLIKLVS